MNENDPQSLRRVYFEAWQKHLKNEILSPMEAMMVDIILRHPEYQPIFNNAQDFEDFSNEKFMLDHNPFFHLALHVTVGEQIGADRPPGIRTLFQKLMLKHNDKTKVEHLMMECLAKLLVESFTQQNDEENEQRYLEAIQRLI